MIYLFYFFAILAIVWELRVATQPKRTKEFVKTMMSTEGIDMTLQQKTVLLCMLGYLVWTFVGLFTQQWIIFGVIFIISFIPKQIIWIRVIDAISTILLILFAIINQFHLKINLVEALAFLF